MDVYMCVYACACIFVQYLAVFPLKIVNNNLASGTSWIIILENATP